MILAHAPREWNWPSLAVRAPNLVAFRPREPVVTVVYVAIGFDVMVIDRRGDRGTWRETASIETAVDYATTVSRDMGWRFVAGDAGPWLERPCFRVHQGGCA